MRFKDKVIIITGAGSGMGRATAIKFAQEGGTVIVATRSAKDGNETVRIIEKKNGAAIFMQTDVSQEGGVRNTVELIKKRFGKIDILFNNAGVGQSIVIDSVPSTLDTPMEIWDNTININLKSVFLCCKYIIPVMIKNGGGIIINNASISGLKGLSGNDPNTASKGGVISYTKALAVDLANKNIRVNCICPGAIETPMLASEEKKEEVLEFYNKIIPMARVGKPEEVASVVLFLASDEASYITGAIVPVDGGWNAC